MLTNTQGCYGPEIAEHAFGLLFALTRGPLTPKSRSMIGSEQFSQMKRGAYLISVARGKLVQTDGMIEALEQATRRRGPGRRRSRAAGGRPPAVGSGGGDRHLTHRRAVAVLLWERVQRVFVD